MNADFKARIARIRETVSLPDLLLSYGTTLRQTGSGYIAKCISHEDNNPSMSVYRADNFNGYLCICHACSFKGDVIDVYEKLTGADTAEAVAALEGNEYAGRNYAVIKDEPPLKAARREVFPPPDDAPDVPWKRAMFRTADDQWIGMGEPVATWCYRTPEGKPWYYEARYVFDGKKQPRCWTWGKRGSQPARWELGFPPAPRPLYGLDEIAEAVQILVCEGPRKAEAARKMLDGVTSVACVGWAGGANGVKHSDWSPLAGKSILLMPDNDAPGIAAMKEVGKRVSASSLFWIDTAAMPESWDTADALADGWDKDKFVAFLKANKREYAAPEPEPEPPPEPNEPPDIPFPPPMDYIPDDNNPYPTEWPEPMDIFDEVTPPQVKEYMLPECIADWCMDTAGIVGVDPTTLVLPAIVAAASLLHDEIQLQPEAKNPSWRESARLWGAIVGEPSSKKSPAISRALSIVKKIDAECNEREAKIKYEFSLLEKAHKTQESAYVDKVAKGDKTAVMPVKPEMPAIHRAIAQDFTIESLRDILKHTGRGVLAERDELSGWFGSMDAYKRGGGSDRAAWLETYNGGSRRIERVGAGSVFVKNWSACIIGGIQPEPMRALASGMHEDGLLQRFIVIYGRPGCPGNEQTPNKPANERYREVMRQLWDIQPAPEGAVKLSEGANNVRREIVGYAYKLIDVGFVSTAMSAHLGKWEGLSARVLLTFHAIECADRHVHPQSCEISEETAQKVKAFMIDLLLPHATTFYTDVLGGSDLSKQIYAIGNLILARNAGEITLSGISSGCPGWRNLSDQMQATVINRLIDAAWLHPAPSARTNSKRMIATRYLVNPGLHKAHAERAERERIRRAESVEIFKAIRGQ